MSEFRVSSGDLHLHLILEGGHDPSVERYMADAKRWEELAIDSWVQLMPNPYIYIWSVCIYIYIYIKTTIVGSITMKKFPNWGTSLTFLAVPLLSGLQKKT